MSKYQAVKAEIANQLPTLIAGDPGYSSQHYEKLFLANNPHLNTLGDKIRKGKLVKTVLEDKVNDVILDLKLSGQVQKVGNKYYPLGFDLSTTPKTPKTPKKVAPVVEETVEETVETVIEVSVNNPAVIEAHIDTSTNELVENVGGSQDWRKPLDEVEDGYITSSSVQVSTTTLMPLAEETEEDVDREIEEAYEEEVEDTPVEVEDAPVETEETEEVVEPIVEEEDGLEVILEEEYDLKTEYDLKALRNQFDPVFKNATIEGKDVSSKFKAYRDMENRKLLVLKGDYLLSIDIDIKLENPSLQKWADKAREEFDNSANHKSGCDLITKALNVCKAKCCHTHELAGFVEDEECLRKDSCAITLIWKEGSSYVNLNEPT